MSKEQEQFRAVRLYIDFSVKDEGLGSTGLLNMKTRAIMKLINMLYTYKAADMLDQMDIECMPLLSELPQAIQDEISGTNPVITIGD